MKDKDLRFGVHKAGKFIFYINKLMGDSNSASDCSYFEVLVSENKKNYTCYVNLVEDIKFNLFDYSKYNRTIKAEELIEYNTYVQRRYSGSKNELTIMPLFRLSRSTLIDLINLAAQIKA